MLDLTYHSVFAVLMFCMFYYFMHAAVLLLKRWSDGRDERTPARLYRC